MKSRFGLAILCMVAALFVACSGRSPLPRTTETQQNIHAFGIPSGSAVKNLFAAAQGRALKDADLDAFITAPLAGSDRAIAHQLMFLMPPARRLPVYDSRRSNY